MKEIDIETFKKEGFSFEEIESIKQGLEDIENGNTVSFKKVQLKARKEIFSNDKEYA